MLTIQTPTVRNQRTLIWLQHQTAMIDWSKWDAVVTSINDYQYWYARKTKITGLILSVIPDNPNFLEELFHISKDIPMILLSQSIISLKSQDFWVENFDNILNLDHIIHEYPFIHIPWDGTIQDSVAIFALLCRYHRIVDCPISESRRNTFHSNITTEQHIIPQEVWIFTQFFRHTNKERAEEIKECLRKNCANPLIDHIVLLNEKDYSKEWSTMTGVCKIKQIIIEKRLTYAHFLEHVYHRVPPHVFSILCNSDIYFDNSLLELWKINMKDRMLGLLRWDDTDDNTPHTLFGPRADSQDTWIFLSDSIQQHKWNYSTFQFQLGQPGCDNAFAGHILRNRFVISNPALSFKSIHLHRSNIRNYNKNDYIKASLYINLVPTYIIDTLQKQTPDIASSQSISNELVSFEIKSSSLSNEITYCTMLEKDGRYKWEPSIENYYFQPDIPLYSWKDACVTPNGLVYDCYTIYIGEHGDTFDYWSESNVDIFTPLQKRHKMFAIPFRSTDIFEHLHTYILYYLSRCIRLLSLHPDASFWIPKQFEKYVNDMNINTDNSVYIDAHTACWAEEVVGLLPSPFSLDLGKEDITSLRQLLPQWLATPIEYTCTILSNDIMTFPFIQNTILPLLQSYNPLWKIRIASEHDLSYDKWIGSSMFIFIGGISQTWASSWALPNQCTTIEFQQELSIEGQFQHIAHICNFNSWVLLLSKGNIVDVQEQIKNGLEKWCRKNM